MSREIKFRIWDRNLKQFMSPVSVKNPIKTDQNDFILEQWTGLYDRHGREIYEGDIIQYQHHSESENGRVTVRWAREYEDSYPGFRVSDRACQHGWIEVIGNIHEVAGMV